MDKATTALTTNAPIASGPPKKRTTSSSAGRKPHNRSINSVQKRSPKVHNAVTPTVVSTTDEPDGSRHSLVEISPPNNSAEVNADIAGTMSDWSHIYAVHAAYRATSCSGASKKKCIEKQKHVSFVLGDFLDLDERVYAHHLLLAAANEITERCKKVDPLTKKNGWTILENNQGKNDLKRLAANYCMKDNKELNDLIQNFVFLVYTEDCCGGQKPFACGGGGEEFSITLLLALVGAQRQQEHTDYNPDLFRAYEDFDELFSEDEDGNEVYHEELETSCNDFNGASMFVNFSWNNDHKLDADRVNRTTGEYVYISLPAMSIVIITGDYIHAGSANTTDMLTRKFFLYLDPRSECRRLGVFKEGKGRLVNDNFIYFGFSRKTINNK
jgi:hypothetical protein